MHNHIPVDGDVFALSQEENATKAEFVNTNGRMAWRLYDRFGKGVLLTEEQMALLASLTTNALSNKEDK